MPSTTTLLPLKAVAEAADVSRQTIYNWLEAGTITHRFDVAGSPVFTEQEANQIMELAKQRVSLRNQLRLK